MDLSPQLPGVKRCVEKGNAKLVNGVYVPNCKADEKACGTHCCEISETCMSTVKGNLRCAEMNDLPAPPFGPPPGMPMAPNMTPNVCGEGNTPICGAICCLPDQFCMVGTSSPLPFCGEHGTGQSPFGAQNPPMEQNPTPPSQANTADTPPQIILKASRGYVPCGNGYCQVSQSCQKGTGAKMVCVSQPNLTPPSHFHPNAAPNTAANMNYGAGAAGQGFALPTSEITFDLPFATFPSSLCFQYTTYVTDSIMEALATQEIQVSHVEVKPAMGCRPRSLLAASPLSKAAYGQRGQANGYGQRGQANAYGQRGQANAYGQRGRQPNMIYQVHQVSFRVTVTCSPLIQSDVASAVMGDDFAKGIVQSLMMRSVYNSGAQKATSIINMAKVCEYGESICGLDCCSVMKKCEMGKCMGASDYAEYSFYKGYQQNFGQQPNIAQNYPQQTGARAYPQQANAAQTNAQPAQNFGQQPVQPAQNFGQQQVQPAQNFGQQPVQPQNFARQSNTAQTSAQSANHQVHSQTHRDALIDQQKAANANGQNRMPSNNGFGYQMAQPTLGNTITLAFGGTLTEARFPQSPRCSYDMKLTCGIKCCSMKKQCMKIGQMQFFKCMEPEDIYRYQSGMKRFEMLGVPIAKGTEKEIAVNDTKATTDLKKAASEAKLTVAQKQQEIVDCTCLAEYYKAGTNTGQKQCQFGIHCAPADEFPDGICPKTAIMTECKKPSVCTCSAEYYKAGTIPGQKMCQFGIHCFAADEFPPNGICPKKEHACIKPSFGKLLSIHAPAGNTTGTILGLIISFGLVVGLITLCAKKSLKQNSRGGYNLIKSQNYAE